MSSFCPGPTASCTVFLPGLVNYPGRLLTSITRCIGPSILLHCRWCVSPVMEWVLNSGHFSASKSGVDLYADRLMCRNMQYFFSNKWHMTILTEVTRTSALIRCTLLSKAKIWPILCNTWKTLQYIAVPPPSASDHVSYYLLIGSRILPFTRTNISDLERLNDCQLAQSLQ